MKKQIENQKILIGKLLKNTRNSLGLTQEYVAEKLGLAPRYISDIERCNRNISIDNIERIANAFNVTASDLLKENFKC